MKIFFSVSLALLLGAISAFSQTVSDREMRERMTVAEDKITNTEGKLTILGTQLTTLSAQVSEISQKIEKGLATWQCAANCGKEDSGYGQTWFANKGYLIGEDSSSGAAFMDLLDKCRALMGWSNKKKEKPDSEMVKYVFSDPQGKISATMLTSCLKN